METEEKLLLSRAEDALRLAEKHYSVKTLGFLTPTERVFLQKNLVPDSGMQVLYDGGFDGAERTLLVCAPDFAEPEPEEYLSALECTGRELDGLSHRDYLGSLMGLGIVRESIGDIVVLPEKAFIMVKPEQTEYILQNLTKIGRRGVRLRVCGIEEVQPPQRETKEISTTVSALRLDSILASAIGVSRGRAAELIRGGLVTVNWELTEELSKVLKEGDVFSVRGYGRFCLSHVGGTTRKGRQSIVISRYI